ncbi:acetyltransferase [Rhodohalobacter mucosus]|uniref:PglD N-terminal domain-containing protein n=1 Tax=Rhodohalobacter mucosus TaxID=2079485 RepID=A0A316TT70_9BACT|nr:acetyltransferase [Rhodohalobacter mucosus]PWN07793.1 hypothetical protein DDZ15_01915 [Rhodohalobacter mucosus]
MEKLYIIGAGSVGGHIATNLKDYIGEYELAGFYDDDDEKQKNDFYGFKVHGPVSDAQLLDGASIVIGIAFPKIKRKLVSELSPNKSLHFPPLVHKKAWVSTDVPIGKGAIIYPGNSINYGSELGEFVLLNMNCALGHHTTIGNFSSLAPGVNTGGHTKINEAVDVGIGASTLQDVCIGKECIIGGQSMVINNIEAGRTVAGVPAKVIR